MMSSKNDASQTGKIHRQGILYNCSHLQCLRILFDKEIYSYEFSGLSIYIFNEPLPINCK